jgi:hypothetical protein
LRGKRLRFGSPPANEMTDSSIATFRISLINDLGTSDILSEKILPMFFSSSFSVMERVFCLAYHR